MWATFRVWLWQQRLKHAKQYRVDLEHTLAAERKRADNDVAHCETMLGRARVDQVRVRADERLGQQP